MIVFYRLNLNYKVRCTSFGEIKDYLNLIIQNMIIKGEFRSLSFLTLLKGLFESVDC